MKTEIDKRIEENIAIAKEKVKKYHKDCVLGILENGTKIIRK